MSLSKIILNHKKLQLHQTFSMKKILVIFQIVALSQILVAQNNDALILQKYEVDGFRFELSKLLDLKTDSSVTKQVEVFNAQNQSIFKESFIGMINRFSPSNILQMDVYDFDFDGFPDFRLIPIYNENSPNKYYTFDKKDGTFHLNCLLSSIFNIKFYTSKKEIIGFSSGNLSFITGQKSENIPQYDFTNHKIFASGMLLKTVKIESKMWLNPWNGPYSNDIYEMEKNKYVQNFNYENCVFDYIGETTIEKSDFSPISPYFDIIPKIEIEKLKPLPIRNEIIPKRITHDNFNHPIRDTVIDNISYSCVIYDLNHTPIEIGQDYTNNVRNGNWIFLDQNGRIVSIVNYTNDTLNGIRKVFNDKGVILMHENYMNGKQHGTQIGYKKGRPVDGFFVDRLLSFSTSRTPHGPVIANPIEQGTFKAYISTGFLGLDPLVTQDLLTLREKLAIQHGVSNEGYYLVVGGIHDRNNRHDELTSQDLVAC